MPPKRKSSAVSASASALAGLTFCMTGTMSVSRSEMEGFIQANGGEVAKTVSNKCTHLISAETGTKKCADAEKKGATVVDEAWVRAQCEGGGGGEVPPAPKTKVAKAPTKASKALPSTSVEPKTKAPKIPKTVMDKVLHAVKALDHLEGTSQAAIKNYLQSEFDYSNKTALAKALTKAVQDQLLTKTGQRYKIPGFVSDDFRTRWEKQELVGPEAMCDFDGVAGTCEGKTVTLNGNYRNHSGTDDPEYLSGNSSGCDDYGRTVIIPKAFRVDGANYVFEDLSKRGEGFVAKGRICFYSNESVRMDEIVSTSQTYATQFELDRH